MLASHDPREDHRDDRVDADEGGGEAEGHTLAGDDVEDVAPDVEQPRRDHDEDRDRRERSNPRTIDHRCGDERRADSG